ncbi:MAG: nucleotide-binding protein [Candidatus Micrarchaeota archaeon]
MAPRQVIIDTNFLLVPFRYHIDILRELDYLVETSHRFVIASKTVSELETLGARIGKHGMGARLALKLIEANRERIDIIPSRGYVDTWIVRHAKAERAIVCTNDSGLRRRLREHDIKVITLKSKTKLGYV